MGLFDKLLGKGRLQEPERQVHGTRKGIAYRVFSTEQMDTTRSVTEVTVKLDDIGAKQVAFYIAPDGAQPEYGDALEWDTNNVTFTKADGSTHTVHKIGYDFDPDGGLH